MISTVKSVGVVDTDEVQKFMKLYALVKTEQNLK